MLESQIIEPATSDFISPVCLAKKNDGSWRFCIDFRQFNKQLVIEQFPLPKMYELIDHVKGSKYFITLDLSSGYWQLPLGKQSQKYTTSITHNNTYQFRVLPFGLSCAPAVFQRSMQQIFNGLDGVSLYWYMHRHSTRLWHACTRPFCCAEYTT